MSTILVMVVESSYLFLNCDERMWLQCKCVRASCLVFSSVFNHFPQMATLSFHNFFTNVLLFSHRLIHFFEIFSLSQLILALSPFYCFLYVVVALLALEESFQRCQVARSLARGSWYVGLRVFMLAGFQLVLLYAHQPPALYYSRSVIILTSMPQSDW